MLCIDMKKQQKKMMNRFMYRMILIKKTHINNHLKLIKLIQFFGPLCFTHEQVLMNHFIFTRFFAAGWKMQ